MQPDSISRVLSSGTGEVLQLVKINSYRWYARENRTEIRHLGHCLKQRTCKKICTYLPSIQNIISTETDTSVFTRQREEKKVRNTAVSYHSRWNQKWNKWNMYLFTFISHIIYPWCCRTNYSFIINYEKSKHWNSKIKGNQLTWQE